MKDRVRPPSARGISVQEDWQLPLHDEKELFFHSYGQELETTYVMLSVSLNEAIEYRGQGRLAKACQAVCVTPNLCARLAKPLVALLWALNEHSKHYGTVPNVAPLDPINFRGLKAQRSARLNALLCHVLFSGRLKFLHKVGTLAEMAEDLGQEFCIAAWELANGTSVVPDAEWRSVDAVHYDLNTCLRETIVLLKSFLVVLPESELVAFQETVQQQLVGSRIKEPRGRPLMRHRRIASAAGE